MRNPKLVAKMLRQLADRIEAGQCGLDQDELVAVGSMAAHIKLTVEQTCQTFGISRPTLYRWVECGKLPRPRKDSGGKEYFWLDEAEDSVEEWERSKND